jgi:hypothetical protein
MAERRAMTTVLAKRHRPLAPPGTELCPTLAHVRSGSIAGRAGSTVYQSFTISTQGPHDPRWLEV